jgi:two-component system, response regulator
VTKRTVLLVEDNADDEVLALKAFRNMGVPHEVVVERDGEGALDYLFRTRVASERLGAPPPDLVLLDLNLPGIGGLEVLRRIREDARTRLFPVVVLTSSVEHRDLLRSYSLGANSYIHKPVNFDEFVETVRHLATYWLVRNQPPPEWEAV